MTPSSAPSPRPPAAQPGPANRPSGSGQPTAAQRPGAEPELAVVAVLGYN
jgi:hypothetical protein